MAEGPKKQVDNMTEGELVDCS